MTSTSGRIRIHFWPQLNYELPHIEAKKWATSITITSPPPPIFATGAMNWKQFADDFQCEINNGSSCRYNWIFFSFYHTPSRAAAAQCWQEDTCSVETTRMTTMWRKDMGRNVMSDHPLPVLPSPGEEVQVVVVVVDGGSEGDQPAEETWYLLEPVCNESWKLQFRATERREHPL